MDSLRAESVSNAVMYDTRLLTIDQLREFAGRVRAEQDLEEFHLYITTRGDIRLNSIIAKTRNRGNGTAAMLALGKFADQYGRRVILTTAEKDAQLGTTSRRRLIRFYRRFGFRPNQGRRYDCQVLDDMIRDPAPSLRRSRRTKA